MLDDVSHSDAVRFIDDCENRRIPILGFEWFERGSDGVMPIGIADFSTAAAESTWAESRRLLRNGIPDGADTVEFVTGDPLR